MLNSFELSNVQKSGNTNFTIYRCFRTLTESLIICYDTDTKQTARQLADRGLPHGNRAGYCRLPGRTMSMYKYQFSLSIHFKEVLL